jgi:chromosome segregation ATPase
MSAEDELETLQRQITQLRLRIEHQAKHVEGLADYPDLADRASAVLARDLEELRQALVQFEATKARADKDAGQVGDAPPGNERDIA